MIDRLAGGVFGMAAERFDLEAYGISSTIGFLPDEPPLDRLPEKYCKWEELVSRLPELLREQTLRVEIDNRLPLLTVSDTWLTSERHWNRAYLVLTFLSQGYMWEKGEEGTLPSLPQQLAVPWWETSHRLGLPPVATYAAVVLWNWRFKDPQGRPILENLEILTTYTGTRDEEWFYLISMATELAAAEGIKASVECLSGVKDNNKDLVIQSLKKVEENIGAMKIALEKMYKECNPEVFYGRIRQFQGGSKDLKAFSNGLIFNGVHEEPKGFIGASAAQSSTLPVFDILLGVEHLGKTKQFLDQQRWHMPRLHRQFLIDMTLQSPLRQFVIQHNTNKELIKAYNICVEALTDFRNHHIILVTRYIVNPAKKQSVVEEGSLATRGTGGSDFMVFLKSVRDDTHKCIIDID